MHKKIGEEVMNFFSKTNTWKWNSNHMSLNNPSHCCFYEKEPETPTSLPLQERGWLSYIRIISF